MPAFQPYWGKPAVRNDRGDRGNVGIIRSPVRASILPDCWRHAPTKYQLAQGLNRYRVPTPTMVAESSNRLACRVANGASVGSLTLNMAGLPGVANACATETLNDQWSPTNWVALAKTPSRERSLNGWNPAGTSRRS